MEPKKILIHLVLTSAIIYFLTFRNIIPGMFVGSVYSAFVVASLMGLLSIAARTILVTMKVPMKLLTLWVFAVFLNTAVLWFIGESMDPEQFSIDGALNGWLAAFLAALIISAAQTIVHKITD
ncbi:MAG: phage holin family protein [Patescibacteria group bacterium]